MKSDIRTKVYRIRAGNDCILTFVAGSDLSRNIFPTNSVGYCKGSFSHRNHSYQLLSKGFHGNISGPGILQPVFIGMRLNVVSDNILDHGSEYFCHQGGV